MSMIKDLYENVENWGKFLLKHYPSIHERTNKPQTEIINYLWKWYNAIL